MIKKIKIFILVFLLLPSISFAFTEVSLEKNVDQIKSGETFDVNLNISSKESINAIDGAIEYDKNVLEIKSINIDDSILTMWVQNPIFDNTKGELILVGGIPEGYVGQNGKVLTINFKAKKNGNTLIKYKDIFSVYKNDGKGTNINPWLKPLSLEIEKGQNKLFNYKYLIYVFILILILVIIKLVKFKR